MQGCVTPKELILSVCNVWHRRSKVEQVLPLYQTNLVGMAVTGTAAGEAVGISVALATGAGVSTALWQQRRKGTVGQKV